MVINKNTNFGTHNTTARGCAIEYIVIHYVGATGDAKANVDYYNKKTTKNASADFFVGHDGDVWQYNPDSKARYCWSVGGKKQTKYGGTLYGTATNQNTVSVEMCVKSKGSKVANSPDWYFTDKTIASTIELVKELMVMYNIPLERVIRHYDVNGKLCPGVVGWNDASGSEKAWDDFKASLVEKKTETIVKEMYRVRKTWKDAKSQLGAFGVLENAKKVADANPGYAVYNSKGEVVYPVSVKPENTVADNYKVPFLVNVKIADLKIRKGPGTNYGVVRYINPGIYTIVEVKEGQGSEKGWGKLKSGLGWISLGFVSIV